MFRYRAQTLSSLSSTNLSINYAKLTSSPLWLACIVRVNKVCATPSQPRETGNGIRCKEILWTIFKPIFPTKISCDCWSIGCRIFIPQGLFGKPQKLLQTQADPAANISPEQAPETPKVKLGYIPIVEAAPLIVAKVGFFAKYGMSDVDLSKQASWGSMRITLKWLRRWRCWWGSISPMPHLITEGQITRATRKFNVCLAQLITHGNGIALASKHGKRAGAKLSEGGKTLFDQLKSSKLLSHRLYLCPS